MNSDVQRFAGMFQRVSHSQSTGVEITYLGKESKRDKLCQRVNGICLASEEDDTRDFSTKTSEELSKTNKISSYRRSEFCSMVYCILHHIESLPYFTLYLQMHQYRAKKSCSHCPYIVWENRCTHSFPNTHYEELLNYKYSNG